MRNEPHDSDTITMTATVSRNKNPKPTSSAAQPCISSALAFRLDGGTCVERGAIHQQFADCLCVLLVRDVTGAVRGVDCVARRPQPLPLRRCQVRWLQPCRVPCCSSESRSTFCRVEYGIEEVVLRDHLNQIRDKRVFGHAGCVRPLAQPGHRNLAELQCGRYGKGKAPL